MTHIQSRCNYNHVYTYGWLCLQILQDSQHDGFVVDVFPQLTLTTKNGKLRFGIGLSWLVGSINFGWMTASFRDSEKHRHKIVAREAEKLGISRRQQELRWGW